MKRLQILIPETLHYALRRLAYERNVSIGELVRKAIKQMLKGDNESK